MSWLVSLGRWRAWQQAGLSPLAAVKGGRVLEVGFGLGHMLVALAAAGFHPVGLDLSPYMLRQARRRLARLGIAAPLIHGRAEALPFAAAQFDAVLLTFPTPFVYRRSWLEELTRILRPGGRLVVVESAYFTGRGVLARAVERLYRITGQRGTAPDLPALLGTVGLAAQRLCAVVDGSRVELVLADKPS